jgi:hypothetical protein
MITWYSRKPIDHAWTHLFTTQPLTLYPMLRTDWGVAALDLRAMEPSRDICKGLRMVVGYEAAVVTSSFGLVAQSALINFSAHNYLKLRRGASQLLTTVRCGLVISGLRRLSFNIFFSVNVRFAVTSVLGQKHPIRIESSNTMVNIPYVPFRPLSSVISRIMSFGYALLRWDWSGCTCLAFMVHSIILL